MLLLNLMHQSTGEETLPGALPSLGGEVALSQAGCTLVPCVRGVLIYRFGTVHTLH